MTHYQVDAIQMLEPLMRKALSYERIYRHHPNYEDYYQNLNLKLLSWLREHPDYDPKEWQGHLFNHFCWTIKNLKKQNYRYLELQEKLQEQPCQESYDLEEDLEIKTRLVEINAKLTPEERKFLKQRLAGQTIKDIAQRSNVSRPTVYKWRRDIQKKYNEKEEPT